MPGRLAHPPLAVAPGGREVLDTGGAAAAWAGCLAVPVLLWAVAGRQPPPLRRLLRTLAAVAAVLALGSAAGGEAPWPRDLGLLFAGGLWVAVAALVRHLRAAPEAPPPAAAALPPETAAPPAEEPYRLLFEKHPAPMWLFDAATLQFLAVNEAALDAYGYTHEQLLAKTVLDVCPGEDVERLAARGWEDGEGSEPLAWRHRTSSGALLKTDILSAGLDAGGRPVRLVVASELTNRRRAEEALREREALLRSLLAHIPCGVFWKDRASIYLGCNDHFARDRGVSSPGEVIGQTDYELGLAPEEADQSRASDRQVLNTATPLLNVEETHARPNGVKVTLLTSRVPMRDGSGAVVGVLGVYQDVSDRKRLEEQLRQSQKMEAIGRLAGGVAHDFNNLLTIISCNVHLIRQLPRGDGGLTELVDDIHDAADRAAGLTRQLLTFSRKQPLRPEVLDLSDTVGGLAGLLRRLLGERIAVKTDFARQPVRVRADRGQLEQVVMNLAVNAKDAMPDGGTLTLATGVVTAPSPTGPARFAQFTLTDTGVGMTDEIKARIFEPFFTTKEVGKGTGLGLATVYGIVEQAGGAIEVDSVPGEGTTFRIRLPLCETPAAPSSANLASPLAGKAGGGRAVLLVEDEERIRKVARHTLEGQGYAVTEADRAEVAIGMLRPDARFDLLVTDLVMPGIDGRELAGRVRALWPGIGVVFISGYVPDLRRLDDLPGALFLPKPFTPFDLTRVAARAVGRTKATRDPRENAPSRG
jgi:two-component system cell cycle sensor histidine kinase/response regulator CckA